MTNREAFATALAVLGATFDRKLSPPAVEGYWIALQDLTEEEFKRATGMALVNCKFMPAPSELLSFVRKAVDPGAAAMLAWQEVRKAIDKYDYLVASIDFGSLVNAVIRNLGGWDTLCRATLPELDNPGWLRKRFDEVYRRLATVEPTALSGEPLEGALPPRYQNPVHAVVSISGQPAIPRLEASGADDARKAIQEHIRNLADQKAPE